MNADQFDGLAGTAGQRVDGGEIDDNESQFDHERFVVVDLVPVHRGAFAPPVELRRSVTP